MSMFSRDDKRMSGLLLSTVGRDALVPRTPTDILPVRGTKDEHH
jgi:hypothetical protein